MSRTSHKGKGVGLKQIAIYGKGGIGKSTISANLSAAMACAGARVLQIGCDPKQDSTRLLLEGRRVMTVLDYLRATSPNDRNLESIVHTGFAGVACVEAGGPEPGVGCAGRGILSALDLLEALGIGACRYDVAVYDVLGDVVCGGFAVPLREQYADVVYIVTSGEFMSLYAANNILRGVRNFEERGLRMGGILLNRRELADENERVRRFADAVRLPIVASFPRSQEIGAAEKLGQTVMQAFPEGAMARGFVRLAEDLLRFLSPLPACPLCPDDLEAVILNGGSPRIFSAPTTPPAAQGGKQLLNETAHSPPARPRRYHSKSVNRHEILHGCAFNGAVHTLMQIRDAVTLAHGPHSCAYISCHGMAAAVRRAVSRYGSLRESLCAPALQGSEMDERVVIFGGNDALEKSLRGMAGKTAAAVFVVTTCAAGIIGDDVHVAIEAALRTAGSASAPCVDGVDGCGVAQTEVKTKRSHAKEPTPATPVIPIEADGDINGDYMQGIIDAMISVADRYIDPAVSPEKDAVNIIAEKNLAANTEANFMTVAAMLDALGLRVNCRFIRNCTTEQLKNFLRGRVNLLASADFCGRTIRDYLIDRYGAPFLSRPFPVGFNATESWLTELAALFGKEEAAADVIRRERVRYAEAIDALRPFLGGKRLFIVTQSYQIDWVLDLAFDLGMDIVKVGILASSWDDEFVTRYKGRFPLALSYTREERDKEIRSLDPDLTLTNAVWRGQPDDRRVDVIPIIPDAGFRSGVAIGQRWQRFMQLPPKEGWRYDI